jgi:hypothetical protein
MMNTLIDRINEGMTTEQDARLVEGVLNRLAAYDMALRRIAVHGTCDAAMLATRTLHDPESAYEPAAEAFDAANRAVPRAPCAPSGGQRVKRAGGLFHACRNV